MEAQDFYRYREFNSQNPNADRTRHLKQLADLMDSRFPLPFGIRVGWDGILGFIPGIGDLVTNGFALYIFVQAAMLGAPNSILARMGLNLLIDNLLDSIPILGNFFDFFWKANLKNVALLDSYALDPRRTVRRSRIVVGMILTLVVVTMVLSVVVAITLFFAVLNWISAAVW